MMIEHKIRMFAGVLVLVTLALGYLITPWLHLLTALVGANLLQSSLTKWCLMENWLRKAAKADGNHAPAS